MRRKRVNVRGRARVIYRDSKGRIKRNVGWRDYLKGKKGARVARVKRAKKGIGRLILGRIPVVGDLLDAYDAYKYTKTLIKKGKK